MGQKVYVRVIGFSDEERHTLNTVFRLSEQSRTSYQLWSPTAAEPARVALLDGQSWEARVEAESPLHEQLRLVWVGPNAPASVAKSFARPIVWPDIDAWALLSRLRGGRRPIQHLALTKAARSMGERLKAWGSSTALLEDPPDPERLDAWLSRIELGPAG